jgi:hypothetical protein
VGRTRTQFNAKGFWFFACIGVVGMSLRLFDKWVLRGASLADTVLDSREMLSDAAAGPVAAFGGLLYPFCFIPLIMWWFRPNGYKSHPAGKWIAVLLFLLPAMDAMLLLSRSQMLIAFSMMYFAAACVLYKGRALPRQFVLPVLIGVLGLAAISSFAFMLRLNEMKMDLAYSIMNSVYGYVVTPNDFAKHAISDSTNVFGQVLSGVLPLMQYYLHGFAEFGLLWDRPDKQYFLHGAEHFTPYLKALMMFGYAPATTLTEPYYRSGVFTTFFGPLWVDFGWFGPLLMFVFGKVSKFCAESARAGELAAAPLHAYLCVVIFFMPVVNFIVSAQGMYIINALAIFWLWMRKRSKVPPRVGQQFVIHGDRAE